MSARGRWGPSLSHSSVFPPWDYDEMALAIPRVPSWLTKQRNERDFLFGDVSLPKGLEKPFPETPHHHPLSRLSFTAYWPELYQVINPEPITGKGNGKTLHHSGSLKTGNEVGSP